MEYVPEIDLITFKRFLVKTATGSLLQDVRGYHAEGATPATLLEWLRGILVDEGEADRRVYETDSYSQAPYQTVSDYISQYRYRFNRAYNVEDMRNDKLRQRLIRQFVNGLGDEGLRLRVAEARPASMDQAFQLARASAHTRLWVRQDQRHRREEPMEIDATTSPQGPNAKAPKAKDPEEDLRSIVSQAVANQLKGFQKQLGQIMKRFPAAGPAVAIERPTQRDIRCYGCGRQGHIRRDCPAQGNGQRPPRHQ